MKTDSEARTEWYPSPQRGWTLDGSDDGIGTSALAGADGQGRRSQPEKQPRRSVRVARRYAASPARVFDAWLDPAVARQWLFATAWHPLAHVEIDARVEGSFCFVDRQDAVDGTRYTGEYLEITPPQRLVFTLSLAKHVETRVTVEIAPLAKGCRLTLLHENVPRDHAGAMHGRWTGILFGLGAMLDSATPLFNDRE